MNINQLIESEGFVIEKENKEFLDQATERAAEIEEEPAMVALSPLENRLPTAILGTFLMTLWKNTVRKQRLRISLVLMHLIGVFSGKAF